MTQYGIAKHRTSGERWAIALGHNAMIAEAYGPLEIGEGMTAEDVDDILTNQFTETLEDTATWLDSQPIDITLY